MENSKLQMAEGKIAIAKAGLAEERVGAIARASFAVSEPVLISSVQPGGDDFDIQWMPPGPQAVLCFVTRPGQDTAPEVLRFSAQALHAELLNRQLQAFLRAAAAGEEDEPFFDFNHEDGAASGHPTELYWAGDDKKKGGIRARGKWSGSGKEGIRNGDWRRFSPQWYFDEKTGEPIGIGVNLGGLVNRAAFKRIARVAAKNGGALTAVNREHGEETMNEAEFKKLLDEALKPLVQDIGALKSASAAARAPGAAAGAADNPTAQAGAADGKIVTLVTDAVMTAIKPINERLQSMDKAESERATAAAKAVVQRYVEAGAIAPEDTKRIEFWEGQVLANAQAAEAELGRMPKKRFVPMTRGTGSSSACGVLPEERITAAAKEAVKTNTHITELQATDTYLRSPAGDRDYREYREALLSGDTRFPKKTVEKN
jgi:hypothetical protein